MARAPKYVADAAVGGWIEQRLGTFGTVGGLVPLGFEYYLQVGHRKTAQTAGHDGLSRETLSVLCEVLAQQNTVDACFFGVWEGHGWIHGSSVSIGTTDPLDADVLVAIQAAAEAPAFPDEVANGPRLDLPSRSYLVFDGPLASALAIGRYEQIGKYEHFKPHAPDLIWPSDRSWFIATDVDLWFAYLGGSTAVVEEVTADQRLETKAVPADDWFGKVEPH